MEVTTWPYVEEIYPSEATVGAVVSGVKGLSAADWAQLSAEGDGLGALLGGLEGLSKGQRGEAAERIVREDLKGIIRLHQPRALPLAPDTGGLGSDAVAYAHGTSYLVKLGVEFDLPLRLREAKYGYRRAYYRTWLSAGDAACLPAVLRVYPDRLVRGERRTVRVELKPSLSWNSVEGSLGSVATDVQVGVVAPATVGFAGDEQRAPYWEMTEQGEAILGPYDFWFVLDVPRGCDPAGVRLALLGEGDLKFSLGPFLMGPWRNRRVERPEITLAQMLPPGG